MNAPTETIEESKFTTEQWEALIQSLRAELQEHGALLNLLTEQQACIIKRDPKSMLELNEAIGKQLDANNSLRLEREGIVEAMLSEAGIEEKFSVKHLMPFLPERARVLLRALLEETFSVTRNTQFKAQQNQQLINRLSDVIDKVFESLQPPTESRTYSREGIRKPKPLMEGSCIKTSV